MQTLSEIRRMLEERGVKPKRSLGQNFLIDQNLVRKLVDQAEVRPGDVVLEVGPGTGTLTEELLSRGGRVVACELDDTLADLLTERAAQIAGGERLTVVHGDCLDDKRTVSAAVMKALGDMGAGPGRGTFSLVANLPYGAGTPLMLALLASHPECIKMAVTVQREVAERALAKPGTKEYGVLSVVAQAVGTVRRVAVLGPECFWPRPEVTSVMMVIERTGPGPGVDMARLAEFCKGLFGKRRKQLGTILGRDVPWPAGVRAPMRPEELTVAQIAALMGAVGQSPVSDP